jgi:hypothetical protein
MERVPPSSSWCSVGSSEAPRGLSDCEAAIFTVALRELLYPPRYRARANRPPLPQACPAATIFPSA